MSRDADKGGFGIPFENGVLQLDGQLQPHNPNVMRTWCIAAEYQPDAQCPEWEKFLSTALAPDQELLAQEWSGYVISGAKKRRR